MKTRPNKKERQKAAKSALIDTIAKEVTDHLHRHYYIYAEKSVYTFLTDTLADTITTEIKSALGSIDYSEAQLDIIESIYNEYQSSKKIPDSCQQLVGNVIIKNEFSIHQNIKYHSSGLCRIYGLDLPIVELSNDNPCDHLLHSTTKRIQQLESKFYTMLAKVAKEPYLSQLKMESCDDNVSSTASLRTRYSIFKGKQLEDTRRYKEYVGQLESSINALARR